MSLFKSSGNETEKITIEHGDELDTDTKILLINSIDLLERVQKEWHRRGVDIDMTCRMQLRQDCAEMEKAIRAVDSRMCTASKVERLQNIYLRLSAEAETVLKFHISG